MAHGLGTKPNVWLVGDAEHADFAEAVALVRATANVGPGLPEVVLVAQSRPGVVGRREWMRMRRNAPLAGFVSLVGSWCEGETRTGRPPAGVERLYWYEFPAWWQRQLVLRAAGCCPAWARTDEVRVPPVVRVLLGHRVAISAERWDTAAAIDDAISAAGGESVWLRSEADSLEGVTAGIWVGGQLGDAELSRLIEFCSTLASRQVPVVALLDFPRRDRCEAARHAGAAAVLGKPWMNADLVATLRQAISPTGVAIEAA
jgi:hypothetical protein